MSDEPILITLQDPSGPYQASASTDDRWLQDRVATGKGRFRLESGDDDTEGHAVDNLTVLLRAFEDDDDTEGHAIAVHFPSREEADAFRKRLVLAGVLTGTIALGAAGGIGLSSLNQDAAGTASGAAATSAQGMDWTQAERQVAAPATAATQGMDWTQAERPGQAAAATTPTQGMDWTQAERPGQAGAAEDTTPDLRRSGTPTPE